MIFDAADAQRVAFAIEQVGIEKRGDVGGADRAIADAASRGLDFDQRFEPEHATRAVAHEGDVEAA